MSPPGGGITRRWLLGLGAAGAAVGVGGLGAAALVRETGGDASEAGAGAVRVDGAGPAGGVVPFDGAHQAGILTPAQDHLHFAAFDVTTRSRAQLAALLGEWTAAARRMTTGGQTGPGGAFAGPAKAPPADTGEAADLPAARLTVTVGFGATLFNHPRHGDRFGLAARRPAALVNLPHFPGDNLDPARCGGDLCVQAAADDPQVAGHAIRTLARIGFGRVALRWSQVGFGRTASTTRAQATPRNLFGLKDGTNNLRAEDTAAIDEHVWVAPGDGPAWLVGGSYLVARRIRMLVETWDRTSLAEQEAIIGRFKGSGAPLTGVDEFDPPVFAARTSSGDPVIGENAHVRLAHPDHNDGARMLRRGYNFIDGSDELGRMITGLFFLAFQRDPRRAFIAVQRRLARNDVLNEYIQHVGSGIWACPPGLSGAGSWGDTLLAVRQSKR